MVSSTVEKNNGGEGASEFTLGAVENESILHEDGHSENKLIMQEIEKAVAEMRISASYYAGEL